MIISDRMNLKKKGNGYGVASLVLGIIGLITAWLPFSFIIDILAIIFGAKSNDGNGTAGKVMGIIGLILNGLLTLIIFLALIIGMGATA